MLNHAVTGADKKADGTLSIKMKDVKKDYKDKGDLGLVAMQVSRFFTSA